MRKVAKCQSLKKTNLSKIITVTEISNTDLNEDVTKELLMPKLDAAEDILNEAIDFLDNLNTSNENKKVESATVKLQASIGEELIQYIMDESSKILFVVTPSADDVIRV